MEDILEILEETFKEDDGSTTGSLQTSFNVTSLYDSEIGKQHRYFFLKQI